MWLLILAADTDCLVHAVLHAVAPCPLIKGKSPSNLMKVA